MQLAYPDMSEVYILVSLQLLEPRCEKYYGKEAE